MQTWDAIMARRNVRSFTDRPIPAADLDRILEAGRRAPSSTRTGGRPAAACASGVKLAIHCALAWWIPGFTPSSGIPDRDFARLAVQAAVRVSGTESVPGGTANTAAQRIEQDQGDQGHHGDSDRRRHAENQDRKLEQSSADSAYHYRRGGAE